MKQSRTFPYRFQEYSKNLYYETFLACFKKRSCKFLFGRLLYLLKEMRLIVKKGTKHFFISLD